MNGVNSIYIKSFHGVYKFDLQRFVNDSATNYFHAVDIYSTMTQHHESHELCRYRIKYSNLLPYRKLKEVIDIK